MLDGGEAALVQAVDARRIYSTVYTLVHSRIVDFVPEQPSSCGLAMKTRVLVPTLTFPLQSWLGPLLQVV